MKANDQNYDANAPQSLIDLQEWFATLITQPIDQENRICSQAKDGTPIEKEALRYIVPSASLKPHERLEIYSQQYWWRLLNTLHDNFPLTTRLLGYKAFNQTIGFPSLVHSPPNHFSLNHLGKELPLWIKEHYRGDNKALIEEAVAVDWAYVDSFFAQEYATNAFVAAAKSDGDLTSKRLFLQPHLYLFSLSYPLLELRDHLLDEDVKYWESHPLPKIEEKEACYVVYRNGSSNVSWASITPHALKVLSRFKEGATLEEVCCWIDTQDQALVEEAYKNLHSWFQEWTIRSWICLP